VESTTDAAWVTRIKGRAAFVALVVLATVTVYAEGVLKSGWIEVALLAPVAWYLVVPDPPGLLKPLLLSLAITCLALAGLDLFLRPVMGHRLHYRPENIFTRKLPRLPILGRWDAHAAFTGEGYGDLAAMAGEPSLRESRLIEFRTDAAGFRNQEDNRPIDLVVVGDSFAAGVGTIQEQVFPRLLETRYGRRTYNLSYPGGPWLEYVNFAIESPRLTFTPKALLLWTLYTGNDLDDTYGATWDIEALPWRSKLDAWTVTYRTFRNRSPLNQLMEGLRRRVIRDRDGVVRRRLPDGGPMLFHRAQEMSASRTRMEVERHQNFPKLEQTLGAMRALTGRLGVDVVILILPTKGEVYRWVLNERAPRPEDAEPSGFAAAVLAACERNRLECIDTKPVLVERARRLWESSRVFLWWRDDTHLNERGHEAVAAFIAVHVLGMGSEARR
jgi:hypothetical protein